MKLTLGDIRFNTRIPAALGMCPTDARIAAYAQESQQRMVPKLHAIGTWARLRLCVTSGCVTMPPQIASIERAAMCGQPMSVRSPWYELLDNGLGVQGPTGQGSSTCCGQSCGANEMIQRGWYPTFDDVRGTSKKLVLACDLSTDVGDEVLLLGYDENNNWIRHQPDPPDGPYFDGELVALAQGAGTTTTHFFDGGLVGLQLPVRDGQVWLWELDTVAMTQRLIGSYQYWETNPSYARYLLPSVLTQSGDSGCLRTTVEVLAKLEPTPLRVDTDYLLITNVPALKSMMQAVKQYEEAVSGEDFQRATAFEAAALRELDAEIDHYLGEGREVGMNVRGLNFGIAHPIPTLL